MSPDYTVTYVSRPDRNV